MLKTRRILIFSSLVYLLLTISCSTKKPPGISFYYWKTRFKLSVDEKEALKNNHVNKLYIRYFDLELNNEEVRPSAPIVFDDLPNGVSIIPVVFIKNEVMLQPRLNADELSKKVLAYIDQINKSHSLNCAEIQFDCDWTLKSRGNYFKFLSSVDNNSDKIISSTIRLHQVKYLKQSGVPKVDYGILMYYNMGKISADTSNSVYDRQIAERYSMYLKAYPLPLKIALPIYSWGVHIRDRKVIGLLNKLDQNALLADGRFYHQTDNFFKVKSDGFVQGRYFQKDDIVKIESISENDLYEMASDLQERMGETPKEVIFYDLDSINLKHYEKTIFGKTTATF